jgi:hypothetical protein
MHAAMILIHSLLRWVVLLTGLLAVARGVAGWRGRPWSPTDASVTRAFIISLDVQFLIGVVLYVSLLMAAGSTITSMGDVMRNPVQRFFLVEHPVGMIAALALAHIGNARLRKRPDQQRHRTAAVFFGIALVLLILSIPWPGMPAGRPLWPW